MIEFKISINEAAAVTPESLGLVILPIYFASHEVSTATIEAVKDFEDTPPIGYGDKVEIIRVDGMTETTVFTGTCSTRPKWGSPSDEGWQVEISDAWYDLSKTIYEEEWQAYQDDGGGGYAQGSGFMSMVLLGVDSAGLTRNTAETITAILEFAASVGVEIQAGTFPAGMKLRPNQVRNATCAELIKECLLYHHDWMTWIDYSTTPPTFNIAARASATTRSFAVDGTDDPASFKIERRDDLRPLRCIIKVETAGGVTGVTGYKRGLVVDMYPPPANPGPDPIPTQGPGVLIATVPSPSAGGGSPGTPGQINTTKARIRTRAIPQPGVTSSADAKAWLKIKYPHLADVPNGAFNIINPWSVDLVEPDVGDPDPVDEDNPPPEPDDYTDIPNELIDGQITDWMNAMVGRVRVTVNIEPSGTETAAERLLITRDLPPVVIVATDKSTGTYSKVTSITYGSEATGTPIVQAGYYSGLAQAYFNSLDQWAYQGRVILEPEEIPADRHIGCAINLTGGEAEWETMNALVNRVSWDIQTKRVTIQFGPPRWLSFADFIAMADALRRPPGNPAAPAQRAEVTFGFEEEEGEELRDQGFYTPESLYNVPDTTHPWKASPTGGTSIKIAAGDILGYESHVQDQAGDESNLTDWMRIKSMVEYDGGSVTVTAAGSIWAKLDLAKGDAYYWDEVTGSLGVTIQTIHGVPSGTVTLAFHATASPPTSSSNELFIEIAKVDIASSVAFVVRQILSGNPIVNFPMVEQYTGSI